MMIDTLLFAISSLLNVLESKRDLEDEASIHARRALALTEVALGDLRAGSTPNREDREKLAVSWQEAAAKVRLIDPALTKEFGAFSRFWADLSAVDAASLTQLADYIRRIEELLVDKNLRTLD